ncbi:MAG: phage major capsid protein [Bacilli bacterium]|jgi:HK97 family phage major capsid protein|nr:phage major capsid protein [Bacilli bacterium]OQA78630.1 MAG: Phage capsid family protein [Tenericutes bacterium ADurb.Bin239]
MNLELRLKEIKTRLDEIRGMSDSETEISKLESYDKEVDELTNERKAIEKKINMRGKLDVNEIIETKSDDHVDLETRGKALKEGRTVVVTADGVLLPEHVDSTISPYPFRELSSLVEQVHTVNLKGGETYKKSFVISNGTGGLTAEGNAYATAEPTFGYLTISKVKVTAYAEITEELEKLPAADYSNEVLKGINVALKKKISEQILKGAGTTNTFKGIFSSECEALVDAEDLELDAIDENTLDEIVYAYGGDEEVEGGCVLILNKNDLRAFAGLRTAEGRKVHTVDYKAHTIDGIPFIISSHCNAISAAATTAGQYCLAYGPLANYEVPIFSGVEVSKSTDYKFKDGIICYKASVFTGGNVIGYNGFLRVKKASASPVGGE